MFNKIKKRILTVFEDIITYRSLILENKLDKLTDIIRKENDVPITKLMRHCLGSIDFSDVKEEEFQSEEERKEHLSKIASVILPVVEKRIKILINNQKDFIATEANGTDQMWFARGSINGLSLLLESLERDKNEFLDITKPPEKFDKQKVIESVVIG